MQFGRDSSGGDDGQSTSLELQSAALAAELTKLVDRMEADWNVRRFIDAKCADQLKALRERAEGLFHGAANPTPAKPPVDAC